MSYLQVLTFRCQCGLPFTAYNVQETKLSDIEMDNAEVHFSCISCKGNGVVFGRQALERSIHERPQVF